MTSLWKFVRQSDTTNDPFHLLLPQHSTVRTSIVQNRDLLEECVHVGGGGEEDDDDTAGAGSGDMRSNRTAIRARALDRASLFHRDPLRNETSTGPGVRTGRDAA